MYTLYTHHHNLEPHNIHSLPSQVQYIQNTFYNIFNIIYNIYNIYIIYSSFIGSMFQVRAALTKMPRDVFVGNLFTRSRPFHSSNPNINLELILQINKSLAEPFPTKCCHGVHRNHLIERAELVALQT